MAIHGIISNNKMKSFLSIITKLKLHDFEIKNGVFAKDLFGTYMIIDIKEDLTFHAISDKHIKILSLFNSSSNEVEIFNNDECSQYIFRNDKKVIGVVKIPLSAFDISDLSLMDKINNVKNNVKSSFNIPIKMISKLIDIVGDINSLKIIRNEENYQLCVDYNDNKTTINIEPICVNDFEEVSLPINPFLLINNDIDATLTLSDGVFMIESNIFDISMNAISTFSINNEDVIKLTKNIDINALLKN